jgi:hypothetical protein
LELAGNAGAERIGVKPGFKRAAECGSVERHEEWRAVEGLWEAAAEAGGKSRSSEEAGRNVAEHPVENLDAYAGRGRSVAEDEVEFMGGECGEEAFRRVFAADEARWLSDGHGGGEEVVDGDLREELVDADDEARGAAAGRPSLYGSEELATDREDDIGVTVNHASELGEHQAAAFALEESCAE